MTYRMNRENAHKILVWKQQGTRNGIQSSKGRTLLKRMGNTKIWVLVC